MFRHLITIMLTTTIFLSAAGCFNNNCIKPKQPAIDIYVNEHPALSELDKTCIIESRFKIGMHKSTVQFLLGDPDVIDILPGCPWAIQKKWNYNRRHCERIFYIEENKVVGIEEL